MQALELENVTYRYPRASFEALKNISLSMAAGESLLLMGRTGAGKTTLTQIPNNLLLQFYGGRFQGRAAVFGQDITGKSVRELSSTIGILLQDYEAQLFSTNVMREVAFGPENLQLTREETGRRIAEALQKVGLTGFERRDPTTLSGGEKQRLAIASLLALKPKIVIMDEPTTDLDPEGKQRIIEIVRSLQAEGTTVLVVSLEIEGWNFIQRAAILQEGQMIFDDGMDTGIGATDMLLQNGVRPSSVADLFRRLRIPSSIHAVHSVSQAAKRVIQSGYRVSENKYHNLLKYKTGKPSGEDRVIIDVRGLNFMFPNGITALKRIDLKVKEGDFLAVIGANGSGKTTLLKHLKGIISSPCNSVLYRGRPINQLTPSELGSKIGFVFQNPDHQIFHQTVWEELIFGPRNFGWSDAKIYYRGHLLLEMLGLRGCEGLDPALLTKGERQKLALASILIMDPEILLLDEPTTGLDYLEQKEIMDRIAEFNREGQTIVMVTHALWMVAEYSNRAVVMSQGEIIYDGAVRNLFSSPGVLQSASLNTPEIIRLGLESHGKVLLSVDEWVSCRA